MESLTDAISLRRHSFCLGVIYIVGREVISLNHKKIKVTVGDLLIDHEKNFNENSKFISGQMMGQRSDFYQGLSVSSVRVRFQYHF